jgi:hypothetical protein
MARTSAHTLGHMHARARTHTHTHTHNTDTHTHTHARTHTHTHAHTHTHTDTQPHTNLPTRQTTLGLTYSLVFGEALLSPAIPSVAARAGGIFFPLAKVRP